MTVRSSVSGACAAISFIATATGTFAVFCPTENVLGPIARILDSFSPWLMILGFLFGGMAAALGGRMVGVGLIIAATASGAMLFLSYLDLTVPALDDHDSDVRVLFFNVQADNTASSDQIVTAAMAADPDIIVFAEAAGVLPSLDRLQAEYKFVSPCTAEKCELLIATNLRVIRFWQLQLNPIWTERYAVLEFENPNGEQVFLAANHLAKPWMSGISEAEIAKLIAQYNWLAGPVVAVGDYNMAPWSLPMRQIIKQTGFRASRGHPATWPVAAGPFAIPIDQILVRGGARATQVTLFGEGAHSNHLGFIADLAIVPPVKE